MTLADRLRTARNAKKLSQARAAELLGIKPSSVAQWELSRSRPDSRRLRTVAELYGVTVEWLLAGNEVNRVVVIQDQDEMAILEVFRLLDKQERRRALRVVRAMTDRAA